jgi:hypothetical protein
MVNKELGLVLYAVYIYVLEYEYMNWCIWYRLECIYMGWSMYYGMEYVLIDELCIGY